MELWSAWVGTLQGILEWLAAAGFSAGFAVVLLTLILRFALLPLTFTVASRSLIHRRRLKALEPRIRALGERYRQDPAAGTAAVLKLYRSEGVSPVDLRSMFGGLVQMPVWLGMFHLLRGGWRQVRFLWIESLARPDFWIALLAALSMALVAAANPDMPESTRALMMVLPAALTFVFALKFASALGLYWMVSNVFTAAQTLIVHRVVSSRIRNGAIRI